MPFYRKRRRRASRFGRRRRRYGFRRLRRTFGRRYNRRSRVRRRIAFRRRHTIKRCVKVDTHATLSPQVYWTNPVFYSQFFWAGGTGRDIDEFWQGDTPIDVTKASRYGLGAKFLSRKSTLTIEYPKYIDMSDTGNALKWTYSPVIQVRIIFWMWKKKPYPVQTPAPFIDYFQSSASSGITDAINFVYDRNVVGKYVKIFMDKVYTWNFYKTGPWIRKVFRWRRRWLRTLKYTDLLVGYNAWEENWPLYTLIWDGLQGQILAPSNYVDPQFGWYHNTKWIEMPGV